MMKLFTLALTVVTSVYCSGGGFALSPENRLSARAPFLHNELMNYNNFGAVDISQDTVLFGRRQANMGGSIWSKIPNEYTDWQVFIKIRISGDQRMGGDGMALWYTKDGRETGPVMGAPDMWTGLGILVDTFDNDSRGNNPAIMGILNNGTLAYNHAGDGEGQYFAGCLRSVRNLAAPLTLRVTYIREMLRVELDDSTDGKDFVNCFERVGVKLPAGYYFGISGMTNNYPDSMELIDMQVYGGRPLGKDEIPHQQQPQQQQQQQHSMAPSAAVNVDELAERIEVVIANQLRQYLPKVISSHSEEAIRKVTSTHLGSLDERIKHIGDVLSDIQHSITGLSGQLHSQGISGVAEHIHHVADELKQRLDALMNQALLSQKEYAHRHSTLEGGVWARHGNIAVFILVQIALLVAFLVVKQKGGQKEKKWM